MHRRANCMSVNIINRKEFNIIVNIFNTVIFYWTQYRLSFLVMPDRVCSIGILFYLFRSDPDLICVIPYHVSSRFIQYLTMQNYVVYVICGYIKLHFYKNIRNNSISVRCNATIFSNFDGTAFFILLKRWKHI